MDNQDSSAPSETRTTDQETPIASRGLLHGLVGARSNYTPSEADQNSPIFKKALEILRKGEGKMESGKCKVEEESENSPFSILPCPFSLLHFLS